MVSPSRNWISFELPIVLDTAMATMTSRAPAWTMYAPNRRRPRRCACRRASRTFSPRARILWRTGSRISESVIWAVKPPKKRATMVQALRTPSAKPRTASIEAVSSGGSSARRTCSLVACPQGNAGPTPMTKSRATPMGTDILSK